MPAIHARRRQAVQGFIDGHDAGTARIADNAGRIGPAGRGQHLAALVFVGGDHDDHVRDAAYVGEIKGAVVGGASGADQAAGSSANTTGRFCRATSCNS